MTPQPQQQEMKKVLMRESHKATALTDGWLCFKYLDNGEESLSTFADISKGDVITYSRPVAPALEPSCQTCINEMAIFCSGCERINTNIPRDSFALVEGWVIEQMRDIKCGDFRKLNKLEDAVIMALRAYDAELQSIRESRP